MKTDDRPRKQFRRPRQRIWLPAPMSNPFKSDAVFASILSACSVIASSELRAALGGGAGTIRVRLREGATKYNLAAALGYKVFRFTTSMLRTDPAGCCAMVAQALALAPESDTHRRAAAGRPGRTKERG